jgi:hypothetical protein
MIANPAYYEIVDFVAARTNPQGVIDFPALGFNQSQGRRSACT